MKIPAALTLTATGAILAFAVTSRLPLFSFQIAGWIIMATGVAGLAIPRRGWFRRRIIRARGAREPIGWTRHRTPGPGPLPGDGSELATGEQIDEIWEGE